MLRFPQAAVPWSAGLALLFAATSASAQWNPFRPNYNNCDCAPAAPASFAPMAASVASCTACAPVVQTVCAPAVQPVMQTVYRQVPVVEHVAVKQTVKKPIVETKYVDQAVTEYRPVTEARTVDVPTVTYQDVTEYQTVMKNMGYWRSRYEPNCKPSPCEYNQTPGFMGWMSRTGMEMRNAFTPNYRVAREYVPQTVCQQVPVTRRVAMNSTRQVTYNVTSMVPYQTTQKVAVASTRWVDEEVTVMKPQTVVKTMAVGTQITYAPIGAAGPATAVQPQPDNIGTGLTPTRAAGGDLLKNANPNNAVDPRRGSLDVRPQPLQPRTKLTPTALPRSSGTTAANLNGAPVAIPTATKYNEWIARTKAPTPSPVPSAISVADTVRP
jgi:hypothetical protein